MKEKIQQRILEMRQKKPLIRKHFSFSHEDLQDSPGECFRQIESYLVTYQDKIKDFSFDSYIVEETMRPVLVMLIEPTEEIALQMTSTPIYDVFLSDTTKIEEIRNTLREVLSKYLYEPNNEQTRFAISKDAQLIINSFVSGVPQFSVITECSPDGQDIVLKVRDEVNDVIVSMNEFLQRII